MPARITAPITSLDAATSVSNGTGVDCRKAVGGTVWYIDAASVTTGGTVVIQSSLDPDGSGWATIATVPLTANGTTVVNVEQPHVYLRAAVSARTDGTYTAKCCGVVM